MNISRFFILRPVATTLLMVAIVLTGWVAWRFLPVSALPEVDYPTMQVVTLYPGASPEVTASSVTAPLERQFGQMSGLAQMSSSSSGGASVITLQFGLDIRLDVAEQEVQAAINAANSVLPSDLPSPPIYNKVNPADLPILTIAVTSSSLPLHKLEDWVDTRLAQKISQVSGVGLVSLGGGQRPAVRVQVNAQALASRGLTLQDIRTSIASANVNQAKGSFDGPQQASTLDGNDQLKSADEYRQLVLAYVSGAPVRLGDVARVVDAAENNRLAAWANTQPAIVLNVQRQPGANVIEVADRIQALLPELKDALPNAVSVVVLSDRTDGIRASVKAVQMELMLAIALVVAVIFVFLRNLSSTVIPAVAVPLSLVGTLGVMYLLGFSINNLTLMALTIATGFVVDDAIVMIENIARYLEQGDSPMNAALKGAGEIGFTIISLTVSLIAVLIPLLFMEDLVGRLFREFALTLAVSILISAGVSLTLTPMMCARFLRHTPEHQQGRFYQGVGRFFDRLIAHYGRMLSWVLNRQTQTLGVALGTLIFTGVLYVLIPKGFFPLQDTNAIQAITEASQSISFSAMSAKQQALAELLLQDPAVDSIASSIGVDGSNATLNTGRMQINLKPKAQRDDVRTVMARLKQRAAEVEGVSLYVQAQQDLTVDSTVSRTQYQFTLQSPNMSDLTQWVPVLMEHLKTLPELSDVTSDLQTQGLQAYVTINRDTASRLGVSTANIGNALYDAFGQRLVSTIFTQTNQYKVVLEVDRTQQDGLPSLRGIYVPSSAGKPVPLESVASVSQRYAPLAIHRLGQFPVVRVSFNLAEGAALGQAVKAIQDTQQSLQMPRQISTQFQGAAVAFQASLSNTLWLMLAAIVTMYIVLGVLYESYIHPVTILSTLPSAGIGALLALQMTGHDLNVIAVIGIVLLIGIVKKNAIMMIDFALQAEREQGMAPRDAIYQACLLRFRPILMTTFAALFGALPLMLGQGMGSELRQPLGVALVGGLLLSQVLTLFTTPVIYLVFDRFSRKSSREGQPA